MPGMIIADPSPMLTGLVEHYWEMTTPVIDNGHPIFPRGSVDIIFNIGPGSGYTKIMTDTVTPGLAIPERFTELEHTSFRHQRVSRSWLVGLHDRPLIVRAKDRESAYGVHLVSARLTPIAALSLFGMDAIETANRVFEIEDLVGSWAREYQERIYHAENTQARFDVLEAFLTALKSRHEKPVKDHIHWISQLGLHRPGEIRVDDLCRHLNISRKSLGQQMKAQIGFSPKRYFQIMRFRRATDILGSDNPPPFAMLAHDLGYADQAHFIRDFTRFAGMSPGQFVRGAG